MKQLRSVFSFPWPLLIGIALIFLATGDTARAISMRHDTMWNLTTSANPYIAEGALYDAVGFIQFTSTAPGGFSYTSSGNLV